MANHEVYVVQGKTLDNIAGTMRAVLGVDKDTPIRFDEVASSDKTEQINADVETQTDLITRIKTALEGKASVSAAEIIALIDQSGVLGTTDETVTVMEKINKVLKMAKWKNYIQQGLYFRPNTRHLIFADIDNPDILDLDFSKQAILSDMFRANPSLEEFIMDFSIVTEASAFLAECSNLKKVVLTNTQGVKYWANAFSGCRNLVSIETLNLSSAISVSRILSDCSSLETIKNVPETIKISIIIASPVLSKESISGEQGIINGLNSEVTGQTLTLSRNAVKKAFETSEGANDGDTSAEWLALKDTKPNWTISLS